jgi:predicted ester cyclase
LVQNDELLIGEIMSTKENVAAVHRLYDELNKGNVDIIDEILDPSFVPHGEAMGLDPNALDRREAMKQGILLARSGLPDLVVTVEDTVAEGDKVVSRLTYRGTHTGNLGNIAPTGREITFTAIAINRFVNGKIVERWFNSDELGMMRQMGVLSSG